MAHSVRRSAGAAERMAARVDAAALRSHGGRDNACFEMSTSPPRYDAPPSRPRPLVITYNWHENLCFDGPKSNPSPPPSGASVCREPPIGAAAAAAFAPADYDRFATAASPPSSPRRRYAYIACDDEPPPPPPPPPPLPPRCPRAPPSPARPAGPALPDASSPPRAVAYARGRGPRRGEGSPSECRPLVVARSSSSGSGSSSARSPDRGCACARTRAAASPRGPAAYIAPHQLHQGAASTAVVAPLPKPSGVEEAGSALKGGGEGECEGKGEGAAAGHADAALSVLAIALSAAGTATVLIGMYLLATEGRRYYLDFGLLAGVVALALSLLAFRVRRWNTPPNRNFLSGMTVSCALALLEATLMAIVAALKPKTGHAPGDLLGGGICGVAVLATTLAVAACLSSCCGTRPPADNRVATDTAPPPSTVLHACPQASLHLHTQGFAL